MVRGSSECHPIRPIFEPGAANPFALPIHPPRGTGVWPLGSGIPPPTGFQTTVVPVNRSQSIKLSWRFYGNLRNKVPGRRLTMRQTSKVKAAKFLSQFAALGFGARYSPCNICSQPLLCFDSVATPMKEAWSNFTAARRGRARELSSPELRPRIDLAASLRLS